MSFPTVIISCDSRTVPPKQINTDFGIFRSFRKIETFVKHMSGNIAPALNNVTCPVKMAGKCSIECHKAIHTIVFGGRISVRKPGAMM